LAQSCFTRALEINPAAVLAHTALLDVHRQQTWLKEPQWQLGPAFFDTNIAGLSGAEQFQQLAGLARSEYLALEDTSRWDDPNLRDRRELARAHAKKYAEDALKLAPAIRQDPNFGTAIYTANMTLSSLALREGDKKRAVDYLKRASQAPESEELTYGSDVVSRWRVVRDLVAQGERQAVIDFLDRMAQTNLAERMDLPQAAAALRRGETPPVLRIRRLQ
jgi:hypothetical protein